MKSFPQCIVAMSVAFTCTVQWSHTACAEGYRNQRHRNLIDRTHEQGTLKDNEDQNDKDHEKYADHNSTTITLTPSYGSSPPIQLTPTPYKKPTPIPFRGRYQNSCGGRVLITEEPGEIFVYVNGRSIKTKDAAELMRRNPDAYRLYDRTLGQKKRTFFARYADWKKKHPAANRFPDAFGDLPENRSHTNPSDPHSVSIMENGQEVSITETPSGMTVSVNGKPVRASSLELVQKKFPEAFRRFHDRLATVNDHDDQRDGR